MNVSLPLPEGAITSRPDVVVSDVTIPQYSRQSILAVWAAAALPMAALAWLVAPAIAGRLTGHGNVPMAKALLVSLTCGLVWQFVLVAVLIWREQRTLRWSTIREALWLRSPRGPRNGHTGGRAWLMLLPFIAAFGAEQFIPTPSYPANDDFGAFLASHVGQSFCTVPGAGSASSSCSMSSTPCSGRSSSSAGSSCRAHERCLRTRRLGRQRRPVRRLPPPYALGHPDEPCRHVHPRIPVETVRERLDGDRRAQRSERVHGRYRSHGRPLDGDHVVRSPALTNMEFAKCESLRRQARRRPRRLPRRGRCLSGSTPPAESGNATG